MISYRHAWTEHWRSQLSYGHLKFDSRAAQGSGAYDSNQYARANLVWAATRGFYLGLEYLYGTRTTRDGRDGDAHRTQFSVQYLLSR